MRKEPGDAGAEAVDDAVLPRDGAREIEVRLLIECDAEGVAADCARNIGIFVGGGMQPRMRQVPPSRPASTSTVSRPSWPARIAAT
jgi:hypothetical protein